MCKADAVPRSLADATAAYRAAQERVEAAKAQERASQEALRAARADLTEALVTEARRGTRMKELTAVSGLSREWIRTRLRQAGVMADD
jgi:multidrug efflux pump subunit AcrA (membrane-fusion protein)